MTTTASQPLAQEKSTGEIVQLWRNAEFKELKEFCAKLQKSGSQPSIKGLAELLSKITSATRASNIYNDLNAFEKAVYLFENAKLKKGSDKLLVPAEARNFDLFVKYHRIISGYYLDGEPQSRDDRLVNELVDIVQKYKIQTTPVQQQEYTAKVGKLNRDVAVIRKGYEDIAATVQRLVDEENKRTDEDNKKISMENSIMKSSFRAKIYQTVFKVESAAIAFEEALYAFMYQIHEFIMPLNEAESYLSDEIRVHKLNIVKQRMADNK